MLGKGKGRSKGSAKEATKGRRVHQENTIRASGSVKSTNKRPNKLYRKPKLEVPVQDPAPNRIVNPLVEQIEAWEPLDIVFWLPDTYPLAYLARLLGVTADAQERAEKDPIYQIPPLGTPLPTLSLQYVDPLYTHLLQPPQHSEQLEQQQLTTITSPQQIDLIYSACTPALVHTVLKSAVQYHIIASSDNYTADYTVDQTVCSLILKRQSPKETTASLGRIRYQFQWYQTPKNTSNREILLTIHNIETQPHHSDALWLVLLVLALEHARAAHVWYALVLVVPERLELLELLQKHVCADHVPEGNHVVCDIHKANYKTIFANYQSSQRDGIIQPRQAMESQRSKHRWLVRLPNVDEVQTQTLQTTMRPSMFMSNSGSKKGIVHIRVELEPEFRVHSGEVPLPGASYSHMPLDILRDFDVPVLPTDDDEREDDLLRELKCMQEDLRVLESSLFPKIKALMNSVVEERQQYEISGEAQAKYEELLVLEEYKREIQRRKDLDLAWQKQLEQDMDAVCNVCNDGEVTPDNQILFCEACNVAVHQMCYGVDKIPEGDYYCIPCRFLGRDKSGQNRFGEPLKLAASPLPICCELCPQKQGAFLRTNMKDDDGNDPPLGRWVHVVCAKWQGLNYVRVPDIVEDVGELKLTFRRLDIKCFLCEGERGCMNQCRFQGCRRWIHVTCARSVGTCNVIHGEDVRGEVTLNPWTLMCPAHSNIKPEAVPKDAISVESLILAAREFPPEPKPDPAPLPPMPFNLATGVERKLLLLNKDYEKALLLELTTKRIAGVRCDVCDQDVESRVRFKCIICGIVFCGDCNLKCDEPEGAYRCPSCIFILSKQKAGEEFKPPSCLACYQKGGWLRPAFAKPISRKSYWAQNKKEFKKSLFGRQLWVHSLCAMWNPKLLLEYNTGEVNCVNVVMTHGKGLIGSQTECIVCGQKGGLKVRCGTEGCHYFVGKNKVDTLFHLTCARQIGYEISTREEGEPEFYVKCHRHGGNEYNFRAKLEDLIEIEKRRAGSTLAKEDQPMNFAQASRLLNAAIVVMRMLGWAWRWADFWVDYSSSWEPLLEPGQREEDMTKEELKIVESTRESRCSDARKCHLAEFGAALRNRNYDTEEDFEREAFDSALKDILKTPSLCGPLQDQEIQFYVHWLTLAYWSRSRLLGFGVDKIEVNENSAVCLYLADKSPKYFLGKRPLPGRAVDSVERNPSPFDDDFLKHEIASDSLQPPSHSQSLLETCHAALPKSPSRKRKAGLLKEAPLRKPAASPSLIRVRGLMCSPSGTDSISKPARRSPPRQKSTSPGFCSDMISLKRQGRKSARKDSSVSPANERSASKRESTSIVASGGKRRGRPPKLQIVAEPNEHPISSEIVRSSAMTRSESSKLAEQSPSLASHTTASKRRASSPKVYVEPKKTQLAGRKSPFSVDSSVTPKSRRSRRPKSPIEPEMSEHPISSEVRDACKSRESEGHGDDSACDKVLETQFDKDESGSKPAAQQLPRPSVPMPDPTATYQGNVAGLLVEDSQEFATDNVKLVHKDVDPSAVQVSDVVHSPPKKRRRRQTTTWLDLHLIDSSFRVRKQPVRFGFDDKKDAPVRQVAGDDATQILFERTDDV